MTTRFTLADPTRYSAAASTDAVRLSPAGRDRVGLAVGDAVRIDAGASTVATVAEDLPVLPEDALLAGEAVRRNAEADLGASLTVEPVTPAPARSVTVRPTQSFSLDGDTQALSRVLAGRYLSTGDRIEARLFGGSVVVSLAVVDLDPPGPVVVTDETTVTVREADSQPTDGPSVPSRSAAVIGGLDEERSTLRRLVATPLSNPEAYGAVGARTPAGVLLSGPSGAGKTRLVRAVAAEAGVPIHELTPTDCESRESLAAVLRSVDDAAPAILLIQNLAVAAPNPDDGSRSHSAVGWLLDRVRERDDLVVVGETTDADAVDPALRRGGRFDTEIQVGGLTAADRHDILEVHTRDLRLAADVDLDALAAHTHGYTGADLEAVVVEAATRAVDRAAGGSVAHTDVDESVAVSRADLDAAAAAIGPSTLREVAVERPSVGYDEIGGLETATGELIRAVEWPLRYPALFERLATDAPTGVLLYGPPGTGKTLLAKAVAASTEANFLAVDGPELMDRYVGESERGVRELFDRTRRTAPSVVFLDELDALAPARRATDTGAAERVVSQLLTELDGLSPRGEVAVIAATNRPESIDSALLRPGRIEKRVEVPLPDRAARKEILAIHLDPVPTDGVDLAAIAAATTGYTGSDLAGVVREAALLAMSDTLRGGSVDADAVDDLVVAHHHLRRAVDRTQPSVDPHEDGFEWPGSA